MRNIQKSGLLWFLLSLLTLGITSCDKVELSSSGDKTNKINKNKVASPRSDSPEPREVQINNHTLVIPNYYIGQNSGNGKFVSIDTYWPSLLSPWQLNTDKPEHHWLDNVEILLDGRNSAMQSPTGDLYEQLKEDARLEKPFYNERLSILEYQYRVYRDEVSRNHLYVAEKNSIKRPNGQPLSIRCDGVVRIKNNPDSIQCTSDYFIRDNLRLTYRFFHKHIGDWKLIDLKVRNLVESYIKK